MRTWPALLLILISLLTLTACDSSPSVESLSPQEAPEMRAPDDVLEAMRERYRQTALVMAEVVRDRDAVDALYRAIQIRDGNGYDENVSFAHMLAEDPALSKAYTDVRAPFTSAFDQALAKAAAKNDAHFTAQGLRDFLIGSGTIVRLPYHDRFADWRGDLPLVVAHPLTPEAEKASPNLTVDGIRPAASKAGEVDTVSVNKSLAQVEPTYIVAPCDRIYIETAMKRAKSVSTTYCAGDGGGTGGGAGGSVSGDDVSASDEFSVFLDWMQCLEDQDSFLDGGPDYRVFIYEPDIDSYPIDPLDDTYDGHFQVNQFSGNDCDNNNWERVGTTWDAKWEKIDEENGFLVYDWDRFGGVNIDYSVGYDGVILGVEVDATAEGSFQIDNNAPLFNIKINRDAFASNNRTNCRNLGTRDGNCVRGGGSSVRFTLGANKIN